MRTRVVAFSLTCLVSIAADSMAGPITIRASAHNVFETLVADTWLQYLNEPLAGANYVLTIGNEARYRKWEDLLIPTADIVFDSFTVHGHSRVVNVRLDAPGSPRGAPHFTFQLLPPLMIEDDWSLEGAGLFATRSQGADGQSKKVRTDDTRCEGPCPTPVPEPASSMLLALSAGLTGVAARWRVRRVGRARRVSFTSRARQ